MAGTTWNPSDNVGMALSGGNLTATGQPFFGGVRTVDRIPTGAKWYWEYTMTDMYINDSGIALGGCISSITLGTSSGITQPGSIVMVGSGAIYMDGSDTGFRMPAITAGDTVAMCLNQPAGNAWFFRVNNGSWNGVNGDPVSGNGAINWALPANFCGAFALTFANAQSVCRANFGDSPFVGVVPPGFTPGYPGPGGIPLPPAAGGPRAMILA